MATNKQFVRYLSKDEDDNQSIYIGCASAYDVVPELKERGTKRILIMCDSNTRRQREFEILVGRYKESGFRVFVYCRIDTDTTNRDVEGGLKIYKEFNCDTIFVIGGDADIYCAKLIAARASNFDCELNYFVGINRVGNKIPTIVCLTTLCTTAVSDCLAVYLDTETNTHNVVLSSKLVPAIALLGSDLFMRNNIDDIYKSILVSFAVGIEAYLSPMADRYYEYQADALNSCLEFINATESFYNDNSNIYYQEKLLVGAFYAGVASRKTGLGWTRIITYAVDNVYDGNAILINKLFPQVLRTLLPTIRSSIAALSRSTYFSTKSSDDLSASQALVDSISRIFYRFPLKDTKFTIKAQDIDKLVNMINKEAAVYGLAGEISSQGMYQLLMLFT